MMDTHEGFEEDASLGEDVRRLVENAMSSKSWGDVPGDMQTAIKLAQISEISWRSLLRKEYGRFPSFDIEYSMRRPDKRRGYPFPGKVRNSFIQAAYVYSDTSASVDDESLGKFLSETSRLAQHMPVYFQCFDTQIEGSPTLIKGRIKKPFLVNGRGGTCFQHVIDDAIEKKSKQIVIFSDGYAPEPDYKGFRGKILWVITKDGNTEVKSWRGKSIFLTR